MLHVWIVQSRSYINDWLNASGNVRLIITEAQGMWKHVGKKKKCCQVESEHKDTSFDTLRHAVTLWSHKEVICLWNIERAQLRKKKSLSPKCVFIQIVHITINLPFSMRDILLWTRVSFKAVVANLHDKSLLHWMSFIFWTYSIVFTSKWIDLTKSFCSLLIDLHPVMANMQYVYVTLC